MPAQRKFWITTEIFLFALAIFLFFPKTIFAQVVINEINPVGEWVELFNLGQDLASLEGCTLYMDDKQSIQKIIFSDQDTIDKFKVVNSGGSWLNNTGDDVSLECPGNKDMISYGSDVKDKSYARSPDGIGNFYVLEASLELPNPAPTPTSTPTSIPTSEPTNTPTPEPTNTPTPIPKPPTPTPTKKPTPTLKPSPTSTPTGEILGEEESSPAGFYPLEATAEAEAEEEATPSGKKMILAKIFLGLGVLTLFGAAFSLWYTKLR